ncbi:MAG TPA: D-glycero-beta-D-manno-heptose 1,7-bisphosphate 7-phosphatase [Bacteroidetes bacterium]|nr:D-glycero-beta-D-manno-heptose 1,7-bisphosphate 7-phosphatase [Bacteroidota bacterium]
MLKDKIKQRAELVPLCRTWRSEKRVIGFTSGAFDLLHAGHVEYLEKARQQCDILIVGLNSDASVRRYKGKNRPVIPEHERIKIVAALASVDYVYGFNERRNRKNIEQLKPDIYIKAGDYTVDQLTSQEFVTAYGGKAVLIPIESDTSTSKIIEKIRADKTGSFQSVQFENQIHFLRHESKSKPAVFVDRDGTINMDTEYLHEPEKFQLLPGVLPGLKKMQDMGFRLIIVTNQAGIGLGYFTKEDFYRVNRRMFQLLAEQNIQIDKIYFCPHSIAENCNCRKPKTGLIEQAQRDLNIDMAHSFMIGDTTIDLQTGKNAGLKTVLVETGKGGKDGKYPVHADFIAKNLLFAADWILALERETKEK